MSYFPSIVVQDSQTLQKAYVSRRNALQVTEVTRLVGPNFVGNTLDATFWATTLVGTGSATQTDQNVALATGATANSAATLISVRKARYMLVYPNRFRAQVQFPVAGATNNTCQWGCFDSTAGGNGCGFQLSGTTFGIFTRTGGANTVVNSGSFNGLGGTTYVVDTGIHSYEVVFSITFADFYVDGVLIHSVLSTDSATPFSAQETNPVTASNVNSGGSTTNFVMNVLGITGLRLGKEFATPTYVHLAANATTVLKRGAGTLHRVALNAVGSNSNTLTLYDNTSGAAPIIAVINTGANSAAFGFVEYGLPFNTGLTAVMATGTAADVTVILD